MREQDEEIQERREVTRTVLICVDQSEQSVIAVRGYRINLRKESDRLLLYFHADVKKPADDEAFEYCPHRQP